MTLCVTHNIVLFLILYIIFCGVGSIVEIKNYLQLICQIWYLRLKLNMDTLDVLVILTTNKSCISFSKFTVIDWHSLESCVVIGINYEIFPLVIICYYSIKVIMINNCCLCFNVKYVSSNVNLIIQCKDSQRWVMGN